MSFFDVFSGAPYGSDFLILTKEIIKKVPKRSAKKYAHYSNSSHRRLISVISIAFSLLFIVVFAILAGIILTGIKIVLKMYSYINPIIYSEIQKLSLIIAFAPEFFYQILKFCYRHSTIHFAPIFLLKEHHFMP